MTGKSPVDIDHKSAIIKYWIEKARESMESATSEFNSGRNTTAVRNL
jgi:HEPN domain-containing protein